MTDDPAFKDFTVIGLLLLEKLTFINEELLEETKTILFYSCHMKK